MFFVFSKNICARIKRKKWLNLKLQKNTIFPYTHSTRPRVLWSRNKNLTLIRRRTNFHDHHNKKYFTLSYKLIYDFGNTFEIFLLLLLKKTYTHTFFFWKNMNTLKKLPQTEQVMFVSLATPLYFQTKLIGGGNFFFFKETHRVYDPVYIQYIIFHHYSDYTFIIG